MAERGDKAFSRSGFFRAGRSKLVADPGNLSWLIATFRLRRSTIFAATAVGLALALGNLAIATPQYRTSARILVDFRRLSPIGDDKLAINSKVNDAAVDSQAVIIDSPGVARTVVEALGLDKDPEFLDPWSVTDKIAALWPFGDEPEDDRARLNRTIDAFHDRLTAERVGVSYVVEISFLSQDAAKAARIVNEVANAYVRDQLAAKLDTAETANGWFQKRVKDLDAEASAADRAVVAYRTQNQIMLVDGKFVDEQQVGQLSGQLISARSERAQAAAKVQQVETLIRIGGQGAVVDEFNNNVVIALRKQRSEVGRRIAEAIQRYGVDHESVQRARSDQQQIDESIKGEFARIADGYRSDAAVAELRETSLAKQLKDIADRSAESQQIRTKLTQLQSVSDTLRSMRDAFSSRYIEASQEQSFPITEARVVSQATQPLEPALPKMRRVLGGGIVLGSGFGCLLALLQEVLSRRTRTREQLEALVGVPCVGVVGTLPRPDQERGILEHAPGAPHAPFAEALRSIRVALDGRSALHQENGGIVVGFASPAPGGGATTVAANFAGLAARYDTPVLLVDLDLRRRSLSTGLASADGELPEDMRPGLMEVLSGSADLAAAIERRSASNLHLLASRPSQAPEDPGLWLTSPAFAALLREARHRYRYVILDLPPIIPVGDARAIAELIDAFFLVVAWNETTLEEVGEALSLNASLAAKLIGTVLNRADPDAMERLDDLTLARSTAYLAPSRLAHR